MYFSDMSEKDMGVSCCQQNQEDELINLQTTGEEIMSTNTNLQTQGELDMQTTKPTNLELYTKGIKQREELITDIDQEITEVNLNIEEADKEIEARQETLLAEARSKYEALGVELAEKRNTLEAAKAVLSDKQAVLKELRGNTTTEEVYLEEDEVEAVPVSEDEEETIIDTPEESSIEEAEPSNVSNETGIYKIDSTPSSILPDTLGEVPVIVEANSIYIIADYEFRVPAEGKFFNLRTINKMIKRLKVLSLEARIKVLEDLSIYFDEKGVERIRERGVLIKDSTGEIKAGDLTTEEEEEDKVSKETGVYKLDSNPTESTTKVDGVYPISSTSDEGWFLDDWEKE